MPMPVIASGVSELIRLAEKQISAGNVLRATELLSNARALEPSNEYISAILERVALLGYHGRASGTMTATPPKPPPASPAVPDNLQKQVRRLTADARSLFERGAYDTAFDTLMKAYLLDPLSADVMQAEAVIVPALELMRKRGSLQEPASGVRPGAGQILRQHLAAETQNAFDSGTGPGQAPGAGKGTPVKPPGRFFARFRKGLLPG